MANIIYKSLIPMESCLVFAASPAGHGRRIELPGTDLWIKPRIDNVFVYPSDVDISRLKEALSHALSLWPLIAGRFLLVDDEHYVIDMSDLGIPFSIVKNTELSQWPVELNVVLDTVEGRLQMFLDEVASDELYRGSLEEPLFRLRMTHLIQNGEWIMATSWAHVLGDVFACLKFLNTLSRLHVVLYAASYRQLFV